VAAMALRRDPKHISVLILRVILPPVSLDALRMRIRLLPTSEIGGIRRRMPVGTSRCVGRYGSSKICILVSTLPTSAATHSVRNNPERDDA
jgi:hypothetical protein